jgi:hypothetical protein
LVSRSFYEVVSCLSLDYASLFSYVGARTDKHVREHEVYSVGIGTDAARRVIETGSRRVAPRRRRGPRLIGELTDARPFGVHRMAFLGAPLAFALLVSSGVAVKAQINHPPIAIKPGPVAENMAAQEPARMDAPESVASAPVQERAQPQAQPLPPPPAPPSQSAAPAKPKPVASSSPQRAQRHEVLAARPTRVAPEARKTETTPLAAPVRTAAPTVAGTIHLAILPWGEVFVNGKSRGVSPPLRSLDMPPGTHTIEVRNTAFPAHTQRVEVRSGEPVRIRHRFH